MLSLPLKTVPDQERIVSSVNQTLITCLQPPTKFFLPTQEQPQSLAGAHTTRLCPLEFPFLSLRKAYQMLLILPSRPVPTHLQARCYHQPHPMQEQRRSASRERLLVFWIPKGPAGQDIRVSTAAGSALPVRPPAGTTAAVSMGQQFDPKKCDDGCKFRNDHGVLLSVNSPDRI